MIKLFTIGHSPCLPLKTEKASKSRGQEMLFDLENLDVMLGGSHFDREESEDSILARRPRSDNGDASENY